MNRSSMDRKFVRNIFQQWDPDGNGCIEENELVDALTKLGIPEEDARKMFSAADVNSDGSIQFEEFVDWLFGGASAKIQAVTRTDEATLSEKGTKMRWAKEAVGKVTPADLKEVSGMYIPPKGGLDVFAGLLFLLDEFPDLSPPAKKKKAKIDVSEKIWQTATKVVQRRDFRYMMQHFDVSSVEKEVLDKLERINALGVLGWAQEQKINVKEKYLPDMDSQKGEHLNYDGVTARGCPNAVIGICGWVDGMRTAAALEEPAQ